MSAGPANKGKPNDYEFKLCILGHKAELRKEFRNHPNIMGIIWTFKSESSLPNQIPETNKEKALSELQTIRLGGL